jgi:hypothetical protein
MKKYFAMALLGALATCGTAPAYAQEERIPFSAEEMCFDEVDLFENFLSLMPDRVEKITDTSFFLHSDYYGPVYYIWDMSKQLWCIEMGDTGV